MECDHNGTLAGNFQTFLTLLTTQLQNQNPLSPHTLTATAADTAGNSVAPPLLSINGQNYTTTRSGASPASPGTAARARSLFRFELSIRSQSASAGVSPDAGPTVFRHFQGESY